MMILAAIVHSIYDSQWRSWSVDQNHKHKAEDRYALIISHAQATSNQLSNNVLAFKSNATPELRKWAEETVARHLIATVTPGHLPRPSAHSDIHLFGSHALVPSLEVAKSTPSSIKYKSARNNYPAESGPYNEHSEVPFRPKPTIKRKIPGSSSKHRNSPSDKRIKIRADGTGKTRAYDTYRPSGPQRLIFNNGQSRLVHRHTYDLPATATPIKHVDQCEQQVLDIPTHEALRTAKLHDLQAKIAQQKSDAMSCLDFADSSLGSSFSGAHKNNTPVVNGPSYTDYLREKEHNAESPLIISKGFTLSHLRNKSFINSEEGKIFD